MKKLIILFCLSGFGTLAQNQANTPPNQASTPTNQASNPTIYQNRVNEVIPPLTRPEGVNNSQVLNVGGSNGFVTPVMIQPNGSQFIDSKIYFQMVGLGQRPLNNLSGYSQNGYNSYEYKGEYILVELGGLFGVLNKFGQKILPTAYKEIKLPSSFDGLYAVKKGKKWGYVSASNKVIIPINFEGASAFDEDNKGLLFQNGISKKINVKGEIIN